MAELNLEKLKALHQSTNVANLIGVAKGLIGPESIRPSGVLRPEAANTLLSLVFNDEFLKNVTTRRMSRLKADGAVMDIAARQLTRVAEGSDPSSGEIVGVSDFSYTLTAEQLNLFANLGYSFLVDNQENPNLRSEIENSFATKLRAELTDLAFNGEGGTFTSGTWTTLNAGWVKLADGAPSGQKIDFSTAALTTWVAKLNAMLQALPAQFLGQAKFIMNTQDVNAYRLEVAQHVTGREALEDARGSAFLTYPILSNAFMPLGTVLLTPPSNLIFGVAQDITRGVFANTRKRVFEYTWTMYADFEIAAKTAVVRGVP